MPLNPIVSFFANEALMRGSIFVTVVLIIVLWEMKAPRRSKPARWRRWPANFGLGFLGALCIRFLFPFAALGAAQQAVERGWGVFHHLSLPPALSFIFSFLLLDLGIYAQHILFHKMPLLWRLHRVHHTDLEFDVSTGVRFHPVEIMLSMAIKMALVVAIGAPIFAVLFFEIALSSASLFSHGNLRMNPAIERGLRLLLVTPDMHRVHHSVIPEETESNFGFCLPWWDRVFATYRPSPASSYEDMTIGLRIFRSPKEASILRLLAQPLRMARGR